MTDKNQPGLTFSIPEIMDTIHQYYYGSHELRITEFEEAFIEFNGNIVVSFNNIAELHLWVDRARIEFDEQETKQSAANDKINAESAKVDFMNQRF